MPDVLSTPVLIMGPLGMLVNPLVLHMSLIYLNEIRERITLLPFHSAYVKLVTTREKE